MALPRGGTGRVITTEDEIGIRGGGGSRNGHEGDAGIPLQASEHRGRGKVGRRRDHTVQGRSTEIKAGEESPILGPRSAEGQGGPDLIRRVAMPERGVGVAVKMT